MTRVTFTFGDTEELCNELLALVRAGRKTATCERLSAFDGGAVPFPEVGRRDIALEWDGTHAVELETTEITIRRFSEVTAGFALAEGENESLEDWRADHKAYFERTGGWSADMMLMCERFRLVRDFAVEAAVKED